MSDIYFIRFHETTNVPYEMVYDSKEGVEYMSMYEMLPMMEKLNKEKENLEKKVSKLEDQQRTFREMF